ncbi:type II secretory pathway component ExeA [Candidatus Termititenax persephonae]|uniref:Type II secretory pathway component ExeA n=1 Tax=Candidatus Termititenax persephonae TaxID=2218525 RepID=A0A388TH14_9BACT|nr:type II secretory pathway component ExeA [Candidatus Termititenax persephonae]
MVKSSIEDFSSLFLSGEKQTELDNGSLDLLRYFGLAENPFGDAVNVRYFYKAKEHWNIYQKMKMSVEQNISLAMVCGQSGSGKTLITQLLLLNLDQEKYQTIVVLVSPGMTKSALLKEVLLELELGHLLRNASQTYDMIRILQDYVIGQLYPKGKRLVIMIDEAHFLEASSLHILRTISNIELPQMKMVSILLFTEEIFLRRIKHESYNSLRNRMYVQEELLPFDLAEMKEYVRFRIRTSGGNPDTLFAPDTYPIIHLATAGIAREVNNLCFNALTEAYLSQQKIITNKLLLNCL